jgi:hypothetical protein
LFVAPKNIPVLLTATRVLGVGIGDALHPPPDGALGFGGGAGFGSVGPGVAAGLLLATTTLIECEVAKALVTVLLAKTEI